MKKRVIANLLSLVLAFTSVAFPAVSQADWVPEISGSSNKAEVSFNNRTAVVDTTPWARQKPILNFDAQGNVAEEEIVITWDAWNTDENSEVSAILQRSINDAAYEDVTALDMTTGIYTDENLTLYRTYKYRIVSTDLVITEAVVTSAEKSVRLSNEVASETISIMDPEKKLSNFVTHAVGQGSIWYDYDSANNNTYEGGVWTTRLDDNSLPADAVGVRKDIAGGTGYSGDNEKDYTNAYKTQAKTMLNPNGKWGYSGFDLKYNEASNKHIAGLVDLRPLQANGALVYKVDLDGQNLDGAYFTIGTFHSLRAAGIWNSTSWSDWDADKIYNLDNPADLINRGPNGDYKVPNGSYAAMCLFGVPAEDYYDPATKTAIIPIKDFSNAEFKVNRNKNSISPVGESMYTYNPAMTRTFGIARKDSGYGTDEDPSTTPITFTAEVTEIALINVRNINSIQMDDITDKTISLSWDHQPVIGGSYTVTRTITLADGTIPSGEENKVVYTGAAPDYVDQYDPMDPLAKYPVGATVEFKVQASVEYGVKSNTVSTSTVIREIDMPRNFAAYNYVSDTAELKNVITWTAPAYGTAVEYVIYRDGQELTRVPEGTYVYEDTAVEEHQEYVYKMSAVSANEESAHTQEATVVAACVNAPSNVAYTLVGNEATVTWTAPANFAVSYNVYLNGAPVNTTSLSETLSNLPYDTEIAISVRTVNAAGKESKAVAVKPFGIKDPAIETKTVVFDDAYNDLSANSSVATMSITDENSIVGSKSIKVEYSRSSGMLDANIAGAVDLEAARNSGQTMNFWVYADEDTDISKLKAGVTFSSPYTGKSLVDVANYVTGVAESGKWLYVEIPLSALPEIVNVQNGTENLDVELNFASLGGYTFIYDNSEAVDAGTIYIDQLTLDGGPAWGLNMVKDNNGTAIPNEGTLAASATAIAVEFDQDMKATSFDADTIRIKYTENVDGTDVDKYVAYHGVYNAATNTYTMNFLEALKASTAYTLEINGVASKLNTTGTQTVTFTTDGSTPTDPTYTVPAIVPTIAGSQNGSIYTVTVAMQAGRTEAIGDYTYTLSYDSAVIGPNGGAAAVTNVPADATVDVSTIGKIKVSGTMSGAKLPSDLMKVTFAVKKAAASTVLDLEGKATINGTAVEVAIDKTVTDTITAVKAPSGNGQVAGGGGGAGADRPVDDEPYVPTTPDIDDTSSGNTGVSFSDIAHVSWAKEAIEYLAAKGIIDGYDDGTFKPDQTITREEFAKLIVEVLGFADFDVNGEDFGDVADNAWYANYVNIASGTGLMNGIADGSFGAGMTISRQDMCTIIYRAIVSENIKVTEKFADYQFSDTASDYAQEAIRQLYRYGFVDGMGDGTFAPFGNVTRAQAAKVLYQLAILL